MNPINHVIVWFEIPVTDMERAKRFYSQALQYDFRDEYEEGMSMAIFNAPEDAVSGMLVKCKEYTPVQTGTVIYFNAGKDLNASIERVKQAGGTITVPKTGIKDGERGYFALFTDSEGNRIGLYSPPQ